VNDINSELQDQGFGVAGDSFNTQVQILGHSLRNRKLTLKVLLGDSMVPVDNSESRVMYQWAKEFMPNLRTAMLRMEKTYGVVPQRLSKLHRQIACRPLGTKQWKRNKSRNRKEKGTIKYGVLVSDSPKMAKEIDRENGNTLWGDAMFVEAQSQIDHTTYLFLGPEEEIPEGSRR
jgi:hypothetical protein